MQLGTLRRLPPMEAGPSWQGSKEARVSEEVQGEALDRRRSGLRAGSEVRISKVETFWGQGELCHGQVAGDGLGSYQDDTREDVSEVGAKAFRIRKE